MKVKELIDQFCEFRGKCTTDDVVALNFAYEMLAPRWISVEDEYPKEEQLVLACNTKGFFMPAKYSDGIWWFYWNLKSQLLDVVYWMPMPTLPNDYLAEASKEAHRIILEKQPKGGEE